MVDQSEYAWRILSKRYGAQLTYTPMFNAKLFVQDAKYRNRVFTTGELDGNVIVQFCANDPQVLLQAAKLVESCCCAVDINLGCPQGIARKGHYGAFLQDEWDLIKSMIEILDKNLSIPVTCKVRIFPDVAKTVAYCKMIQDAGCKLLAVHGRTRDQKGQFTGLADWEQIKRVKQELEIPVFANGNILYFEDVEKCLEMTQVDGVMTAEGSLYNPAIFSDRYYSCLDMCQEYLDICTGIPSSAQPHEAKAHFFKMLHKLLAIHTNVRDMLSKSREFKDLQNVINEMRRVQPESGEYDRGLNRVLPEWVLQPRIRPLLHPNLKKRNVKCNECPNSAGNDCEAGKCKQCCKQQDNACKQHKSDKKQRIDNWQKQDRDINDGQGNQPINDAEQENQPINDVEQEKQNIKSDIQENPNTKDGQLKEQYSKDGQLKKKHYDEEMEYPKLKPAVL